MSEAAKNPFTPVEMWEDTMVTVEEGIRQLQEIWTKLDRCLYSSVWNTPVRSL